MSAQVIAAEIFRRHVKVAGDAVTQTRQYRLVKRFDDARMQARAFYSPVNRALQIGHWAQHIKAVAASWRKAGVGGGGAVKVERKIFGQNFVVKDVSQQLAITFAQPNGVVRNVRVLPGRAEVQNKQTHRIFGGGKFQTRRRRLVFGLDHGLVQMRRVGIGDDHIGLHRSAVLQGDAGRHARLNVDAAHRCVQLHRDALPLHQTAERAGNGPRSTHCKVHAVGTLQIMDEAVDAGGVKGIAADQQRLNRKRLPQLGVL